MGSTMVSNVTPLVSSPSQPRLLRWLTRLITSNCGYSGNACRMLLIDWGRLHNEMILTSIRDFCSIRLLSRSCSTIGRYVLITQNAASHRLKNPARKANTTSRMLMMTERIKNCIKPLLETWLPLTPMSQWVHQFQRQWELRRDCPMCAWLLLHLIWSTTAKSQQLSTTMYLVAG